MQEQLLDELQRLCTFIESVYRAVLNRPPTMPEVEKHIAELHAGSPPIDFFHAIYESDERKSHAKLFVVPGSYQSPIANPAELQQYVAGLPSIGPEISGITIDRAAMVAEWENLLPFLTTCPFPQKQTAGFHYYFENYFFGFGDGLMLHAMLRKHSPKRYIEIGSGFSSACAVDTVDRYLDGQCALTFIEPFADRLLGVVGNRAGGTRIFNIPVQGAPLEIFEELEAGDILFIDSSHVLRTGSDVAFELFEILPRLRAGVFVHIHDISWPFDYPENWILQQNRSYNEAYAVRAFLSNNSQWKVLFFNDYFAKFEGPRIQQSFPQVTGEFGGSLWLQRC